MLMDKLDTLSNAASLTGIAAGATGYSDTIDLVVARDLGPSSIPFSVQFTTLPTSATGGATLNIALQTSADNATWVTLEETSPQPIANITTQNPWAFRGTIPVGTSRYLRVAYTPSAALTAGIVSAQIAADWPRNPHYPKNYVS